MRSVRLALLLLAAMLVGVTPTPADMGPCLPDTFNGLTCGSGIGAARVIDRTLSPDKRLAFAWRDPNREPTKPPADDATIEFLLVRLAVGAVLAKGETGYWAIGDTHASRVEEQAAWSRDGQLVARVSQSRFDTERVELYALGGKDELMGVVDLRNIVEPAVRAPARRRPERLGLFGRARRQRGDARR